MVFEQKLEALLPKPCPFCGTYMMFHHAHIFKSHWSEGMSIRAVDVQLKCSNCFNVQKFGVPLTQKEYEAIVEEFGGKNLDFYRFNRQQIKNRLTALGYLEVET